MGLFWDIFYNTFLKVLEMMAKAGLSDISKCYTYTGSLLQHG